MQTRKPGQIEEEYVDYATFLQIAVATNSRRAAPYFVPGAKLTLVVRHDDPVADGYANGRCMQKTKAKG